MTPLPTRITIPDRVLFQEVKGESVLLNLENDRYYGLDDVGTRMWQLLAEHGDTATVVQRLLNEYVGEVDQATLERDLSELIERLAKTGLITVDEQ
jgi:hypothetical protein